MDVEKKLLSTSAKKPPNRRLIASVGLLVLSLALIIAIILLTSQHKKETIDTPNKNDTKDEAAFVSPSLPQAMTLETTHETTEPPSTSYIQPRSGRCVVKVPVTVIRNEDTPEDNSTFIQKMETALQWNLPAKRVESIIDLLSSDPHATCDFVLIQNRTFAVLRLLGLVEEACKSCEQTANATTVCYRVSPLDGYKVPMGLIEAVYDCMKERTYPARVVCLASLHRIHEMEQSHTVKTSYGNLLTDLEDLFLSSCGFYVYIQTNWRCSLRESSYYHQMPYGNDCRKLGKIAPIKSEEQTGCCASTPTSSSSKNACTVPNAQLSSVADVAPIDLTEQLHKCYQNKPVTLRIECLTALLPDFTKINESLLEEYINTTLLGLGFSLEWEENTPEKCFYIHSVRQNRTASSNIYECLKESHRAFRAVCLTIIYSQNIIDNRGIYVGKQKRMLRLEQVLLNAIGYTIRMKTDWRCLLYKSYSGDPLTQQTTHECRELVQN